MRSPSRFALAALAILAVSAPALAEQQRPRVGVGVGLSTFDFNLSAFVNNFQAAVPDSIYVPITITPTFRIEPQIGVATIDQSTGANPSIESSVLSIGIGAFWLVPVSDQLDIHLGARFVRTSYTSKLKYDAPAPTQTLEGTDLRFIPAVGGEFALHPRFSLGAEAQLQLVSFGDRTGTGGSIPGGSGVQTAGVLFARVYLF